MGELAMALGENAYFDRPVFDRTGLTGRYDITLKFSARVPAKSPMPVLRVDLARAVAMRCTEP